MNSKEFQKVFKEAQKGPGNLDEAFRALDGIGTHNDRVACTLAGCVAFVRYQCLCLDGSWDTKELSDTQHYFKRVTLLDG